jgi:hypothetical protein
MSSYKGIYVQRFDSGSIDSVQVEDPFGHRLPLDPHDYLSRGIQPPMEQLPNVKDFGAKKGCP